jgi:hypothetical protein
VGTCDAHPETLAGGPQTDAAQGPHNVLKFNAFQMAKPLASLFFCLQAK